MQLQQIGTTPVQVQTFKLLLPRLFLNFPQERRSIMLLIDDTRTRIHAQILQRVEVAIINSANASGIRESTASSREILDALQASISAFKSMYNVNELIL